MADHGTIELVTVTALDAMIYQPSAYATPILSSALGPVQYLTVTSLATVVSPLTGYSIAGTLQQEPCPECPEVVYPGFPDAGIIWPPSWLNPGG